MSDFSPYKGVRDFYPEDQRVQKFIFDAMRKTVESFGYEEMNASILESTELYAAKTSEEIVNEQTYTFTDRGDRSVTLRPEMTPTVARMVAARRRELGFPLRWYSIQNFFRYERPQRGRGREFWQLNADLLGANGIDADSEMIAIAHAVMRALGASEKDFVIRVGSREFLDSVYESLGIAKEERPAMTRLLDKGAPVREDLSRALATPKNFPYFARLDESLKASTINNVLFDGTIARGFDYYTGIVFEVFDTNPENPRALFGGGRYDNLIEKYGGIATPAIGFGMGDMVTRDFLETHNLLRDLKPATEVYMAPVSEKNAAAAAAAANLLRTNGIRVALGMSHEKVGDHVKAAVKLGIPYFIAYGDEETSSNLLIVKNLATKEEKKLPLTEIFGYLS